MKEIAVKKLIDEDRTKVLGARQGIVAAIRHRVPGNHPVVGMTACDNALHAIDLLLVADEAIEQWNEASDEARKTATRYQLKMDVLALCNGNTDAAKAAFDWLQMEVPKADESTDKAEAQLLPAKHLPPGALVGLREALTPIFECVRDNKSHDTLTLHPRVTRAIDAHFKAVWAEATEAPQASACGKSCSGTTVRVAVEGPGIGPLHAREALKAKIDEARVHQLTSERGHMMALPGQWFYELDQAAGVAGY